MRAEPGASPPSDVTLPAPAFSPFLSPLLQGAALTAWASQSLGLQPHQPLADRRHQPRPVGCCWRPKTPRAAGARLPLDALCDTQCHIPGPQEMLSSDPGTESSVFTPHLHTKQLFYSQVCPQPKPFEDL